MNQPKVHSYGSLRPVKSARIAEQATRTQEHEEENVESTMPNTNNYALLNQQNCCQYLVYK